MKTTNFCANQLNKLLGRYLLLMECLSHLPMKSYILVHYIICGRQRFFCFRFLFFFCYCWSSFHFVIMGPICIGLVPYFMFDCLLSFFLWVVFHSCSHLLCTFDGWVPVLDFYIQYFVFKNQKKIDATLQNFIYKHIVDLENVLKNKRKEKGEFPRHQVRSN